MKVLDVKQGTPEWLAARAKHFCASDAPAMMGASKYMSRDELLRQKATGDVPTVDAFRQSLYERGHEAEAAARSIVEKMLGEDLFPATITDDAGRLLASYDGITMAGDDGYEHKLWNEELAIRVRNKDLPPHYYWQMEHQALVAGLKRIHFVCSDGTAEKMERMVYEPVPHRAKELLSGWAQFEADLKNYQHVEVIATPAGKDILKLPALTVNVTGMVQSSNLAAYQSAALSFIEAINTNLQTDQDFADAEKTVKFCDTAEKELETVKRQALSQTASIDELFRAMDTIREAMRSKRLELDKLVKARKDAIRDEIRRGGVNAFAQHVAALNTRLGMTYMPSMQADFAEVMKGKKTIASLHDAVNTELARLKIAANETADRIAINCNTLREQAGDFMFLFSDAAQIVLKSNDDFTMLVKSRISDHKNVEEKRRAEEQAKAATAVPQPAPVAAVTAAPSVPTNPTKGKPSDDAMIGCISNHFQVTNATAVQWLDAMDLKAAAKRWPKKKAA